MTIRYQLPEPEKFYELVWEIVRQVPRGQVTTFGQIASMIPNWEGVEPEDYRRLAPRWVGDAMNAVSRVDEPSVPWQRVINAKGMISLPEGSVSAQLQRARLETEGSLQPGYPAVDFEQHGWDGPAESWLDAHGLVPPKSLKQMPGDAPTQLSLF